MDFYCHKAKLAIEVDGEYHLGDANQFYYENRDRILECFGVRTIGFTNNQVQTQLEEIIIEIRNTGLEIVEQ